MSSRRKSKPARRVDSICSKLTEYGSKVGDSETENTNNASSGNSQPIDNQSTSPQADEDRMEGVYVLEPQSVSDGEGPHEDTSTSNDAEHDSNAEDLRKSSKANTPTSLSSLPPAGLDLSVKRPKYDDDFTSPDMFSSSIPPVLPPSIAAEHLMGISAINEEQLRKYQRLPAVVASGKNVTQALEEIGLNMQQFVALHWLNQLNNPDIKKEPISDNQEASLRLTREDFIQQQKQMAALTQRTQPSHLSDNNESASLYNEQELPADDSGDCYKNLLMQTYSLVPHSGVSPSTSRSYDRRSQPLNDSLAAGTVSSGAGSIKRGTLDPATFDQEVFDQYITKFTSTNRCGSLTCQYYTRDHYHCVVDDCKYQRFTNKADVIRHYNMHKKRDNSLAHGFFRFSPADDCSSKYPDCPHKGKSTHYHCMQPDCNKVYTSTSDVMTHENFHKKYMQFVCSGFKRFRATEQCDLESCVFRNQKTTHFHCTRTDCNFTFKNKCDIEKHKTYHQRDDHFVQRGFKKYYKNESCGIAGCVWSMTSNHLHCLRPGCHFSFTSSSQMESHIRKHDRNDYSGESQANSPDVASTCNDLSLFNPLDSQNARNLLSTIHNSVARNSRLNASTSSDVLMDYSQTKSFSTQNRSVPSAFDSTMHTDNDAMSASPRLPTFVSEPSSSSRHMSPCSTDANSDVGRRNSDTPPHMVNIKQEREDISFLAAKMFDYNKSVELENGTKFYMRCSAMKCLFPSCELFKKDHLHCIVDGCGTAFCSDLNMLRHARYHLNLAMMGVPQPLQRGLSTPLSTTMQQMSEQALANLPTSSRHVLPTVFPGTRSPLMNLDGQADQDVSRMITADMTPVTSTVALQSPIQGPMSMIPPNILKAMFQTPPSCQSMISGSSLSGLDFLTSAASMSSTPITSSSIADVPMERSMNSPSSGYMHFAPSMPCIVEDCKYAHQNHWHCTINRCRYVCKSEEKAQSHRVAHDSLEAYSRSAKECFRSYTLKKPCPNPNCEFKLRGHYHCLKPGCTFVTIGTSKLPWHMKKHEKIAKREASGFKYYTKKDNCRYPECKYNGTHIHYHCIRKNCSFAFQYKHQMQTHVRKHARKMQGKNNMFGRGADSKSFPNADSGDDSFPLVIDEMEDEQESMMANEQDAFENEEDLQRDDNVANEHQNAVILNSNGDQLDMNSLIVMSQRPNGAADPITEDADSDDIPMRESPERQVVANLPIPQNNDEPAVADVPPPVRPNAAVGQFARFRVENSNIRGFVRFEPGEECGKPTCPLKEKGAAHYHCTRDNCTYGFAGKSHMYKHAQHHERVAGLVRNDFRRYKGTQPCHDDKCRYRGKNTHFHCLRCGFICTDSAKVGTHRRQHMKADSLRKFGFKRVGGKDDCGVVSCKYQFRNMSHFHCTRPTCSYAIVGLAGIEMHAEKHKKGIIEARQQRGTSLPAHNLLSLQSLTQLGIGLNDMAAPAATPGVDYGQNSSMADVPSSSNDGSDNGHSNRSSPSLPPPQDEPNQILPQFAVLGSASSPVSAASLNRVTEGVGS